MAAGRVPEPDLANVLVEAIKLNPFSSKPWELWIDRFGDENFRVEQSAAKIGMDREVGLHKAGLLRKQLAQIPLETPEDCMMAINALEDGAKRIGLSPVELRSELQDKMAYLDTQSRTVNGVTYETVADAAAATVAQEKLRKQQAYDRSRTFANTLYDTPEDAQQARLRYSKNVLILIFGGILTFGFLSIIADLVSDISKSSTAAEVSTPPEEAVPLENSSSDAPPATTNAATDLPTDTDESSSDPNAPL